MKHIIFAIALLLLINFAWGQNLKIGIKDSGNNPLPGATISLKFITDTTRVHYTTTNQSGIASFDKLKQGLYQVSISYIGFEKLEKTINIKSEPQTIQYQLKESTIALDEITISAARPLIRYEYDKMLIDPEPIAAISSNTLEILENTPGLFVDQDGGIYISGTSPAVIYINGREQRLSNQDITTLLRSLPPGSVERIEVLRTPSTKYDAASSGGIINIVLKKGVKLGRFGSVRAGMNQGIAGNRFIGFSINNSGEKSTTYLNANYNYDGRYEELNSVRLLKLDTLLSQVAESNHKSNQFYTGYGINYDYSNKTNISYDGRINYSARKNNSINNNLIETDENIIISEMYNNIWNKSKLINIQQDFGVNYKIDTIGSNIDTKFSYNINNNNSSQFYDTENIFPFNAKFEGEGDNNQLRHFTQIQTDLTYLLPYEIKIESGIKSTYQFFSSKSNYYLNSNGNKINDAIRTNGYNYTENINAAYLQSSKPFFKSFMIITGARMEHTYMKGNQTIPVDTNFTVNRIDIFPYIYLSRRLFEMAGFEIRSFAIYRKTISRPGYQNLNPYINYVDQFLYEVGNPALKPQFNDNIELNISFDDTPLFAIGQNYTKDIFSNVIYQDDNNENVAIRTYDNLGKSKETYFRAIAGIPPGKKYFFAVGSQYNYNEYDGYYENQPFSFKNGSWRFFTFHSLNLFKETKLTMSGFMMTKGQFNFYELNTFGQLNFGITQTLMDKRLTISLSARDILKTMTNEFTFKQGSIYTYGNRYTDTQRFGINIRYNFGLKKKDEQSQMMQFNFEDQ